MSDFTHRPEDEFDARLRRRNLITIADLREPGFLRDMNEPCPDTGCGAKWAKIPDGPGHRLTHGDDCAFLTV